MLEIILTTSPLQPGILFPQIYFACNLGTLSIHSVYNTVSSYPAVSSKPDLRYLKYLEKNSSILFSTKSCPYIDIIIFFFIIFQ